MTDITDFLNARIDEELSHAGRRDTEKWLAHGSGTGIYERAEGAAEEKRKLIARHQPSDASQTIPRCRSCKDQEAADANGAPNGAPYPCRTLRSLASDYADHPDYQQDWRP